MNSRSKRNPFTALLNCSLLLGLLALGAASGWADIAPSPVEYAARVSTTSRVHWDSGFWPIPNGGTAFDLAPLSDWCSGPQRIGSYSHPASTMTVGQGYGINMRTDSQPGDGYSIAYLVSAYVCATDVSTDVLVSLTSTNATIGVYPGLGTPDACTALQAANCQKKWTPVCYLTNHVGAVHPEIEFHYVSGSDGLFYADCIRFTSFYSAPHPPRPPVGLDGNGNMYIDYYNSIAQTVLIRSFDPAAPRSNWLPVQTNYLLSGTFYVLPTEFPAAFYCLKFQ